MVELLVPVSGHGHYKTQLKESSLDKFYLTYIDKLNTKNKIRLHTKYYKIQKQNTTYIDLTYIEV